ncbi:MAG: sarcosine oxidase subunit gamma [Gammaproteobacteria bacterium]
MSKKTKSESIRKEHPLTRFMQNLGNVETVNPGVRVILEPFLSHINVRGNPNDLRFKATLSSALSCEIPSANRVVRSEHCVYWLGPSEFLIVSRDPGQHLVDQLNHALAGQHAAVTNLSGGQLMMSVTGSSSRRFLSKASTLDLHESVFTSDHCAQSTFAKASALYAVRSEGPVFELIVRRSFADYIAKWMSYAGEEFGIVFDE